MTWKLKRTKTPIYYELMVWRGETEMWEKYMTDVRGNVFNEARDLANGGVGESALWIRRVVDYELVDK